MEVRRNMMHWLAGYADGNCDDGRRVAYAQIKRDLLDRFAICDDRRLLFEVHLRPHEHMQWRRRVWMRADGSNVEMHIVVCDDSIYFVHSDGHVERQTDFIPGHPYADSIVPMEGEEII